MDLSEDGKFRPITIFLYLNELPDNSGVSRACLQSFGISVTSWVKAFFEYVPVDWLQPRILW